jgi:hypothetical protein
VNRYASAEKFQTIFVSKNRVKWLKYYTYPQLEADSLGMHLDRFVALPGLGQLLGMQNGVLVVGINNEFPFALEFTPFVGIRLEASFHTGAVAVVLETLKFCSHLLPKMIACADKVVGALISNSTHDSRMEIQSRKQKFYSLTGCEHQAQEGVWIHSPQVCLETHGFCTTSFSGTRYCSCWYEEPTQSSSRQAATPYIFMAL